MTNEQPVSDPVGLPSGLAAEAAKHLSNWLDMDLCECEDGCRCGRTKVLRCRDQLLEAVAAPAPDEREIAARPGYAGVTVWIGNQQCTQVVDRIVLETSRADELLRHFENARYLLRAGKEG